MDSLLARDKQFVWHPYSSLLAAPPLAVTGGKGASLFLADGRPIIDAVSSWWVNLHGHCHPVLNQALAAQAAQLEHVIFAGFTHEPAVQLAERLAGLLPGDLHLCFYSDNGSTAIEVGVKMALQYWANLGQDRGPVISLAGGYHGDTFGTMSVAERGAFNAVFAPQLFENLVLAIPTTDDTQAPLNEADHTCLAEFRSLCERHRPAAFLYEPLVQGAGGMRFYKVALLRELLTVARQHEVICISDEVMTGFGRLGTLFVSEGEGLCPDIICLSKGLSAGYMPLGLTVCNQRIRQAFETTKRSHTLYHGHSFTANPLACAVALASLDLLLDPTCQAQRQIIHDQHLLFSQEIKKHAHAANVRVQGTILALDVVTGEGYSYFSTVRDWLYAQFLDRGVLLRPMGNTVYVLPPYCITADELAQVYGAIREVLDLVPARLLSAPAPAQG